MSITTVHALSEVDILLAQCATLFDARLSKISKIISLLEEK